MSSISWSKFLRGAGQKIALALGAESEDGDLPEVWRSALIAVDDMKEALEVAVTSKSSCLRDRVLVLDDGVLRLNLGKKLRKLTPFLATNAVVSLRSVAVVAEPMLPFCKIDFFTTAFLEPFPDLGPVIFLKTLLIDIFV